MTNTTMIKSGKMQFNVKSAKTFRDILAKWHNADFELAEKILAKNDRVKSYQTMIDTDRTDLEKLINGQGGVMRDRATIEAEIADFEARKEQENKDMQEYRQEQSKRYEVARNLCTKDMYNAYVAFITEGKREEYKMALAEFLSAQGLEPASVTLEEFVAAVGKRKNSARNKVKTGLHNGVVAYQTWRDLFLGELRDEMGDALPLYKFPYERKDKRAPK